MPVVNNGLDYIVDGSWGNRNGFYTAYPTAGMVGDASTAGERGAKIWYSPGDPETIDNTADPNLFGQYTRGTVEKLCMDSETCGMAQPNSFPEPGSACDPCE